jgi:hypothetical protein
MNDDILISGMMNYGAELQYWKTKIENLIQLHGERSNLRTQVDDDGDVAFVLRPEEKE